MGYNFIVCNLSLYCHLGTILVLGKIANRVP
jgi:hypothetical protein